MLRFLLLEDDPNDVELISAKLANSELDCEVHVVDTKTDFQTSLEAQTYDLVLADYSLPDYDGISAIQAVRARDPYVPCILLSGVLGEERAVEALKSGATDYVLKQRLERLINVIKRALREKQERLQLAQARAALAESEERFRTSVETMLDCLMILSAVQNEDGYIQDFAIRYINQAACQYLSFSPEEQRERTVFEAIPALKTAQNADIFASYRWTVETGRPFQQEILLQSDSDDAQFVALDMRAAKLGSGLVVTWRDVTERRQSQQQQQQLLATAQTARAQAEKADRLKDEFLATLSHELRTPLSAIYGWLQLVLAGRLKTTTLNKALTTIHQNVHLLNQLIDDILDVSRIIQGKLKLSSQPLTFSELSVLIEEAIDVVTLAAQAKNITINFTPCFAAGHILADTDRLRQVVWNLLSNAIKFTPAEGQVSLTLAPRDRTAVIQVTDTGQGIHPEMLPVIFDRFRQANSSSMRDYSGLGLGLSIARHIVELHGGSVTAESPGLGQGSTFTVEIPLQVASEANQSANGSQQINLTSPLPPDISLDAVRVLIVEDVKDARDVYLLMLQECGAEVEGAASAAEAFERFQDFRPHVLVSDISMPGENGYSLIRRIRALPAAQGGQTPAVALTAYARAEERTRALLAGFQIYVPKPVDLVELTTVVLTLHQKSSTMV
ncbi:MAG: response regulator [Leptolyngbya sp. SIO4C1]|nr:response regulator [Leptolyngbya sp. SIO4C1]